MAIHLYVHELMPAVFGPVLKEPVPNHISARKRQWQRPYAVRKPEEYVAKEPGDIVELGTLNVRPLPGAVLKYYSNRRRCTTLCALSRRCDTFMPQEFPKQNKRKEEISI